MKKFCIASLVCGVATSLLAADPVIVPSSVTMSQSDARTVTVTYRLSSGPAVVTLGIETNAGNNVWVALPDVNVRTVYGDVNQLVTNVTDELTIRWQPDNDWPNQKVPKENIRAVVKAWAVNALPDYLVVDLTMAKCCRYYTSTGALPESVSSDLYRTDKLLMRKIPAAGVEWRMGSPVDEPTRDSSVENPHCVTLTNDYFIGVFELTQKQYMRIRKSTDNPSETKGDTLPLQNISYNGLRGSSSTSPWNWPVGREVNSSSVVALISTHSGLNFDLPTSAQWEYACRAGTGTSYNNGKNATASNISDSNLDEVGWYTKNSSSKTHRVGEKKPNAWGLYDMHGNVAEWCLDFVGGDPQPDAIEPEGPTTGTLRVMRGGYFSVNCQHCRSGSVHVWYSPDQTYNFYGVRLKCSAIAK